MKAEKRKKKSIFLRIALLAFSVYVVVMLLQLNMQIRARQQKIDGNTTTIEKQRRLNEDLQNTMDNYEKYLDQQARDQGLAKPGEQIYKEIPEN